MKTKIVLICTAIAMAVAYLIYSGIRDTMTYYLTVSEALARPIDDESRPLRIGGEVVPESVTWKPETLSLRFTLRDAHASLQVAYQGVVPDSFKPGREVVIEGRRMGAGKIVASNIMPKCASKYE